MAVWLPAAGGETVVLLLHPPLPSAGGSIATGRGRQQRETVILLTLSLSLQQVVQHGWGQDVSKVTVSPTAMVAGVGGGEKLHPSRGQASGSRCCPLFAW